MSTQYSSVVLADSPVVYNRLGESSGTSAADASGNGNTGTYSASGVTYSQTGAITQDTNTCVLFDGSAGRMQMPAGVNVNGWTNFTFECWFYLSNTTYGNYPGVAANDLTYTSNKGFLLQVAPTSDGQRGYADLNNAAANFGAGSFSASTWYHLVVSWDGTTTRTYINGAASGTATPSTNGGLVAATYQVMVGAYPNGSNFFPGRIDEVAIYHSTLSASRISLHYQVGLGTFIQHDLAVRGKLSAAVRRDLSIRGKLAAPGTRDLVLRGKLSAGTAVQHDLAARGKLSASGMHDLVVRGKISQPVTRDLSARGKLSASGTRDLVVRGRLSASGTHDLAVRGKIGLFSRNDLAVRGRLSAVSTRDLVIRGKIAPIIRHDLAARGKIAAVSHRNLSLRGGIITRNATGGFVLWANGTGTASFDHFRVSAYPDPSPALSSAGRAINSVVNWNATVPANASLLVSTSLDNGVTYQAAPTAGSLVAGISTQLYSAQVSQRKPIAYYRLTESSGTSAFDSSGNAYTATLHGGVIPGVPGPLQGPGEQTNTAMLFDGISGYVSLPSALSPAGWSTLSVGCWFNPASSPASDSSLVANATPATSHTGLSLGVSAGLAGCFFALGNGTSSATATLTQILAIGTWYYLLGTWDGSTIRLYLDGELAATAALAGSVAAASSSLALGYNPASLAGYWPGGVAEVDLANPTLANATNLLSAAAIFGRYNVALCAVGTIASDSFVTDTHTNYLQTTGNGGSPATWTWDTTSSRLVASGGSKAVLLLKGLWGYETDLLADFYQAQNGGLVWGWQDTLNYYELLIRDSAASVLPNTVTLNKVTGGVSSLLTQAAITFPTGTHHRFHVTFLAGQITLLLDGVQIAQITDASPLPAGLAGLRNETGTSLCYLLQISPQPTDQSSAYLVTKQSLATSDPTATPQITDHQSMAADQSFGVGVPIASVDYRRTVVSDNLSQLTTQSNYWWRVNDGRAVTFQARDATDAPWILQPTDILTGSLPNVEYSADMYRNRQVLTGVFDTAQFTETRTGDGSTQTWTVSNPVVAVPTILLNGAPASVGLLGVDTGKQFYWQPNSPTITQDSSQPLLSETDILAMTYRGSYAIDFALDNTGQIANTISQAQMAAIDGTTGVTEAVEDVSQLNMDKQAATTYATQLLTRYGQIARTITFQTPHAGLSVGQSLPIFLPQYNIFDSVFLVVQMDTSVRTKADGSLYYVYSVTASEAAALSSWTKLFSRVLRSVTGTKVKLKA